MTTVVIPVKALSQAKTRLSPILDGEERAALCLSMLEDILGAIKGAATPLELRVLTSDPRVAELCSRQRVMVWREPKSVGLNESLRKAVETCRRQGISRALFMPGDIPLVQSEDIDQLCSLQEVQVAVTPAWDGKGTNALLLKPPDVIPFRFGPESFDAHVREAKTRGLKVQVAPFQRISWDIDHPEDLLTFLRLAQSGRKGGLRKKTEDLLERWNLASKLETFVQRKRSLPGSLSSSLAEPSPLT